MSYEQAAEKRRIARMHEQLGAIQQDQREADKRRAEQARQAVWRAELAAAEQQHVEQARALDQHRAAGRQVFGSCKHIDRETGR